MAASHALSVLQAADEFEVILGKLQTTIKLYLNNKNTNIPQIEYNHTGQFYYKRIVRLKIFVQISA